MDSFSFMDGLRAAIASCLPCFKSSPSSNSSSNTDTTNANELPSDARSTRSSPNDLEHLLRDVDTDPDVLSLHSNFGAASRRRARQRRRPRFSLTLFGYTLFGRPPIYLSDDEDEQGGGGGRTRTFATASSSTLDSDAAPLDPTTIERLTSPDHHAAAQRERERRRLEEEEQARRKAERRARRQERKAQERASALLALSGGSLVQDGVGEFEGFQGSGSASPHVVSRLDMGRSEAVHADGSNSGDADDADLGGELYARKKRPSSMMWSGSGSDSRSRTSASFSAGDASQARTASNIISQPPIPYPQTEMQLPPAAKKRKAHHSKRISALSSSTTSQSTSTAPYTPSETISPSPAVAAFPIPQERYARDAQDRDFPSTGLSGNRKPMKPKDVGLFLANGDGA
ncbi:hypothetical protein F5I97DRAFT_466812 [Phlebopus sp. FC_14]|nr:hypothetical protein F5I97DRAFT_466812 [Phlebopus sp. FC_14]